MSLFSLSHGQNRNPHVMVDCFVSLSDGTGSFLEKRRVWRDAPPPAYGAEYDVGVSPPETKDVTKIQNWRERSRIAEAVKAVQTNAQHKGVSEFINTVDAQSAFSKPRKDVAEERRQEIENRAGRLLIQNKTEWQRTVGDFNAKGIIPAFPGRLRTSIFLSPINTLSPALTATELIAEQQALEEEYRVASNATTPNGNLLERLTLYKKALRHAEDYLTYIQEQKYYANDFVGIAGVKTTESVNIGTRIAALPNAAAVALIEAAYTAASQNVELFQQQYDALKEYGKWIKDGSILPVPTPVGMPTPGTVMGGITMPPTTVADAETAMNAIEDTSKLPHTGILITLRDILNLHKRELSNARLDETLRDYILPARRTRVDLEKAMAAKLVGPITPKEIQDFWDNIQDIRKQIGTAIQTMDQKVAGSPPGEYSSSREAVDAFKDDEEKYLKLLEDRLKLLATEKGDMGTIFHIGLFDSDFIPPEDRAIGLYDGTRLALKLSVVNTETHNILKKYGITPDKTEEYAYDFLMDMVVVGGKITPHDLDALLQTNGIDITSLLANIDTTVQNGITNIGKKKINPAFVIPPPTIIFPATIPPDLQTEIRMHLPSYIQQREKMDTNLEAALGQLHNGLTSGSGKEKKMNEKFGIDQEDAVDSYANNKSEFEFAGIPARLWFKREDGALNLEKAKHEGLLIKIIAVSKNRDALSSTFSSRDAFFEALWNPSNANHADAKLCLKGIQEAVLEDEQSQAQNMDGLKKGKEFLEGEGKDILEKGVGGVVDMITSGDPIQMAAAAFLLYGGVKLFGKTGEYGKYALFGVGAHIFLKETYGLDLLDKVGLTSSLEPINGSSLKAWEIALQKRGATDDVWEQAALQQESEKTKALMTLYDTDLEKLLDWHQKVTTVTDQAERKKALVKEAPKGIKKQLGNITEDEYAAATICMGLLSISLREATARYGFTAKTDVENVDFGRQLVRAKYYKKLETEETAEQRVVDFKQQFEGYDDKKSQYTFGAFVEKETSAEEVRLSKHIQDTRIHSLVMGLAKGTQDLYYALESSWGANKENLAKDLLRIANLPGQGIDYISAMVKNGYRLGEGAVDEIVLLKDKHKVVIKHYGSGAIDITIDAWLIPFKLLGGGGKAVIEAYKNGDIGKFVDGVLGAVQNVTTGVLANGENAIDWMRGIETQQAVMATGLNIYLNGPGGGGGTNDAEIYTDEHLGHFADQYQKLNGVGALSAKLDNTAPSKQGTISEKISSMEGGVAVFAIGEYVHDPANIPPDFPKDPIGAMLYLRQKAFESAEIEVVKKEASLQGKVDYKAHSVAYVQTQPDPANGKIRILSFLRVPPPGIPQKETSADMKKYEYLAKQAEEALMSTSITMKRDVYSGDGSKTGKKTLLNGNVTDVKKFLLEIKHDETVVNKGDTPEYKVQDFATNFNIVHQALLNPTKAQRSGFLQDPSKILEKMKANFTDYFNNKPLRTFEIAAF